MIDQPNSARARDVAYFLHPYSNLKLHEEQGPLVVTEGRGIYVYDEDGNEYIDYTMGHGALQDTISVEDRQLIVRGRQGEEPDGRVFLHRGIAARQFQRRFVLAEGIEVEKAHTENGLLHIDLARPEPEVRARTIRIDAGP